MNQFKEQPLEHLLGIDCFTVWLFHGGIILSVPLEEDLLGWGLWWDWGSSIFTILCCILIKAAEGISAFKPLLLVYKWIKFIFSLQLLINYMLTMLFGNLCVIPSGKPTVTISNDKVFTCVLSHNFISKFSLQSHLLYPVFNLYTLLHISEHFTCTLWVGCSNYEDFPQFNFTQLKIILHGRIRLHHIFPHVWIVIRARMWCLYMPRLLCIY